MGSCHLNGEKSRSSLAPTGKLSSDLSGWRRRSTSSITTTPERNWRSTIESERVCSTNPSIRGRDSSARWSRPSKNLSMIDLMVAGVAHTTPLRRAADASFLTSPGPAWVARSKLSVKIRFFMIDENVDRIMPRLISSSARGTTDTTKLFPSPSMSMSSGATVEVLPPPISICLTRGLGGDEARLEAKSRTSWTWGAQSIMFHVNSNTKKRGSYPYPADPADPAGPSPFMYVRRPRNVLARVSPSRSRPARTSAGMGRGSSMGVAGSSLASSFCTFRSVETQRLMWPIRLAWRMTATTTSRVSATLSVSK
mmetsp:Transcript_41962/g.111786  ORF Transcript_41962/g.111786 Transcript_41962/m.111786 type:complete len:310 (+) Transcript_41962:2300-3229(+)